MRPERIEHRGGKGLVLVHRCVVCGFARPNRIADDPAQGDDIDAIIALMSRAGQHRPVRMRRMATSTPGPCPAGRDSSDRTGMT